MGSLACPTSQPAYTPQRIKLDDDIARGSCLWEMRGWIVLLGNLRPLAAAAALLRCCRVSLELHGRPPITLLLHDRITLELYGHHYYSNLNRDGQKALTEVVFPTASVERSWLIRPVTEAVGRPP